MDIPIIELDAAGKRTPNIPPVLLGFGFLGAVIIGLGFWLLFQTSTSTQVEVIKAGAQVAGDREQVAEKVFVDVAGAVKNPGLYEVESSDRVGDVLAAAGGLTDEADEKYVSQRLNLAQKVVDGMKLYIPSAGEEMADLGDSGVLGVSHSSNKINLNTASLSELDTLKGIGPTRAQQIIDGRPYSSVDELVSRAGLSESVVEKIRDEVGVW